MLTCLKLKRDDNDPPSKRLIYYQFSKLDVVICVLRLTFSRIRVRSFLLPLDAIRNNNRKHKKKCHLENMRHLQNDSTSFISNE